MKKTKDGNAIKATTLLASVSISILLFACNSSVVTTVHCFSFTTTTTTTSRSNIQWGRRRRVSASASVGGGVRFWSSSKLSHRAWPSSSSSSLSSSPSSSSEINTTTETDTSSAQAVQAAREELLSILLSKSKDNNDNTHNNDNASTNTHDQDKIEQLMDILSTSNVSFDPMKCINGPLYAVMYQTGPKPFWEVFDFNLQRFTRNFTPTNIKGQRFTVVAPTLASSSSSQAPSSSSSSCFDVLNYAEFWGDKISIQACGRCVLMEETNENTTNDNERTKTKNNNDNENELVTCPVNYKVKVQSASINILNQQLNLNVEGIGYTRVLYADEDMRIFLAPKDTTDERWMEKSGLMVVQLRVDLIDSDFVLL